MTMSEIQPNDDEVLLEDLLNGSDKLLTSGEVAELLNVNANTLYLWRTSSEVNLPYQRFVAPGQSRGMIRYRYTDVLRFIGEARQRAADDLAQGATPGSIKRQVLVEISDEEELDEAQARISKALAKSRIKERARNKAKKDALKNLPLEDIIKFQPEFVAEPVQPVVEQPVLVTTSDNEDIKRKAQDALREMMESFNRG
jgi:transposase-like protein